MMGRDFNNGTTGLDGKALAPDQLQLLAAYDKLNNRMRRLVIDLAGNFVENPDNLRTASDDRPALRLIAGGTK